jgi:DeoR/GlpR family transcriptional regulator of sugar metabolism
MFLKERQADILRKVEKNGRFSVTELAAEYDVSEDCIRKDLRYLSDEGRLKRVYGGAISMPVKPERSAGRRMGIGVVEKHAIAQKAFAHIEEGESIYLDTSTTALELARIITSETKHLTVTTCMIDIVLALSENESISVICPGGYFNRELDAFSGSLTIAMVHSFLFDHAFIGAMGVNLANGAVTTFDSDDSGVKGHVIANSRENILLVDSHKFEMSGHFRFASVEDFDAVITDSPTQATRKSIQMLGSRCE